MQKITDSVSEYTTTCTNLIHSAVGTSAILSCKPIPSSSSSSSSSFPRQLGASYMTRGGELVILASIAQGQDDIEAVVGVV